MSETVWVLEPRNNIGYGAEDIPNARDDQIKDLILDLSENVSFDHAKQVVSPEAGAVLSAFAERAATIAVRHQDASVLRAGLFAAALALSLPGDAREVLPAMALLYRASTMIGHDPDSEFAAVNDLTGNRVSAFVDFTRRAPEDRTIEAMGFQEGVDKNGFRFISTW